MRAKMHKRSALKWPDIIEFYNELNNGHGWNIKPLINLVIEIEKSPYAQGLLPSTSHDVLYIAQSENALGDIPRLKIELDQKKQEFKFTYENSHIIKEWWSRTAKASEGFEVLERFLIKRARWYK